MVSLCDASVITPHHLTCDMADTRRRARGVQRSPGGGCRAIITQPVAPGWTSAWRPVHLLAAGESASDQLRETFTTPRGRVP
jgi:hypothetical protein